MAQENNLQPTGGNVRSGARHKITPELVRQVAERVYSMLRRELLLESERARRGPSAGKGVFRT